MSIKSSILHYVEKSNMMLTLILKRFNRISMSKSTSFIVQNIHFKNNTLNISGQNNLLECKANSFLSNYNIRINGKENSLQTNDAAALYANGKSILVLGDNNKIIIGNNCRLNGVNFFISGNNNTISLGDNCSMNDVELHIEQNNNGIYIGNGCTFHGRGARSIHIAVDEGSNIIIQDDCMISNDVQMRSTDSHSIVNEKNERINPAKDIIIGTHCWIGLGVIILKGTVTNENTIVAAGAVCSKKYDVSNCILAGNPARVVKQNVNWDRKFL